MQEEIEHKTVNFAISTTKLSARTLLRGIQFLLRQYDKHASQGKQSMKRLVRQNRGVTNVEIQKTGIKDFDRYAKRYHIDYSIQKDLSCKPPRYLVYFKAQDTDALSAAFKEYSASVLDKTKRPCPPFVPEHDLHAAGSLDRGGHLAVQRRARALRAVHIARESHHEPLRAALLHKCGNGFRCLLRAAAVDDGRAADDAAARIGNGDPRPGVAVVNGKNSHGASVVFLLYQHCTIAASAYAGYFSPIHRLEKVEGHKVHLRLSSLVSTKNFSEFSC